MFTAVLRALWHTVKTHVLAVFANRWVLGLGGLSALLMALALLVGGRGAGAILIGVILYLWYLVRVLHALHTKEVTGRSSALVMLLVAASLIALLPATCSSESRGGTEAWRTAEKIRHEAVREKRPLTPEEAMEVRAYTEISEDAIARQILSGLVWQYAVIAAAWGVACGATKAFDPVQTWSSIDSRTNFALASLSLTVVAVVVLAKSMLHWALFVGRPVVETAITAVAMFLLTPEAGDLKSLDPTAVSQMSDRVSDAKYRLSGIIDAVQARTAITIWELSLLAAGLLYLAVTKYEYPPTAPVSRGHLIRLRLETAALTAAGTLAVLFTALRVLSWIRFWPTTFQWTL